MLINLIGQSTFMPTLAEKPWRVDAYFAAMSNYCSGIGGRGVLLSPGRGGSCAGAGGGM